MEKIALDSKRVARIRFGAHLLFNMYNLDIDLKNGRTLLKGWRKYIFIG